MSALGCRLWARAACRYGLVCCRRDRSLDIEVVFSTAKTAPLTVAYLSIILPPIPFIRAGICTVAPSCSKASTLSTVTLSNAIKILETCGTWVDGSSLQMSLMAYLTSEALHRIPHSSKCTHLPAIGNRPGSLPNLHMPSLDSPCIQPPIVRRAECEPERSRASATVLARCSMHRAPPKFSCERKRNEEKKARKRLCPSGYAADKPGRRS